MKMVKNETKQEITGTVTLEMTPQELATVAASIGRTSDTELRQSLHVNEKHIVDMKGQTKLYNELNKQYYAVFGGKQ